MSDYVRGARIRNVALFAADGSPITKTDSGSKDLLDVAIYDASGNQITTFGADPVGLKDTGGTPINPAKEDGNLATIAGDTTSIDGKITACNTGNVTVGAALPAGDNTIGRVKVTDGVDGNVAHDAADSGNPVKVGAKAIAHGASPTAVAANDRTDLYANRHGIPWVIGGHPNVKTTQVNYTDADGAQTNTAIITVGAGTKIVVTHITVTADNANTTDVQCRIGFGAASTPGNDSDDVILSHPGIPPGGGITIGNGGGIIGVGADGEDLRITCEDPTDGSIDCVVGWYEVES
jgi:hypothetical protein